jgi:polyhydroxybutyrate depolymerase
VKRIVIAITASGALLVAAGFPAVADIVIDLGRGPVTVHVPSSYDAGVPAPLVFLLHGYSATGAEKEAHYQFLPLSEEHGFLYLYPDGTEDWLGNQFWNATDACCNFFGSGVDDVGYLMALIDEIELQLNVDSRRIFFIGHSNGGFMSYRMACEHPETIAAIASLAGATYLDPVDCSPTSPVHVLQVHGTADAVILFNGGSWAAPYPGAVETVEQWAAFDECADIGVLTPPPLDLDASIPGDETNVYRYDTDCDPDGSAELWEIVGGAHSPTLSEDFSRLVVEFLLAHPKSPVAAVEDNWGPARVANGPVLLPATPNPFNAATQLRCRLGRASLVTLTIHDVSGRVVRNLVTGVEWAAGDHALAWDGRGKSGEPLAPGIYFVSLKAGVRAIVQKVVLVR